jgi:squalene-hopene/tetraprenyl-beta-curcumene cyclase
MALCEYGVKIDSPIIMTCLSFLQRTQHHTFGAWGPTPNENMSVGATCSAILAQISADVSPKSQSIQQAIKWVKDNQRDDGGWGEKYKEGSSTSLVSKTYDAISALMAAGLQPSDDTIIRGIQYLLNIQKFVRSKVGEWGWVWSPEVEIEISDIENTATAIMALLKAGKNIDPLIINMGVQWLLRNRDPKYAWGNDTPRVILCLKDYLDRTN